MAGPYIRETLRLIDKTKSSITPITINGDSTGNLLGWVVDRSATNTGIKKTNGGELVLRIDSQGTFTRTSPILNDQNAKFNYLIEYQISQDINGIGVFTSGKLWRMEIRNAVIELAEGIGEVLSLTCIEQQYRLKEAFESVNDYFLSPDVEFLTRLTNFILNYPNVLAISTTSNQLPNANSLKNNWLPQAPTSYHDLLSNVIATLAQTPGAGGTLTDYFFDMDPDPNITKGVILNRDQFGRVSSNVIIKPTNTSNAGLQTNQSNALRSQNYKNQVILKGNATSGSMPMETVKFNSAFTHAEGYDGFGGRPIWSSASVSYNINDIVKRVTSVTNNGNTYNINRYFTCLVAHTSSTITDPLTNSINWFEDFTIIPEWQNNAIYYKGDIVTVTDNGLGTVQFFIAKHDITNKNAGVPTIDASDWDVAFLTAKPTNAYKPFSSYTPWTNNYNDWLTNISGANVAPATYLGYFVDWNYTVANYDPQSRSNQFSYISMKAVAYNQSAPPADPNEIFNGQRILVKAPGTGAFTGQDNKIAQYDITTGAWQFSNSPVVGDVVSVPNDNFFYKWNGSAWVTVPLTSTSTTAFHPIKDMYLTKGASGIPAQAIEFRFNYTTPTLWGVVGLNAIPAPYNFDNVNNSLSRGMWINFWFPFPRTQTNSLNPVGYKYGQNIGSPLGNALGTFNAYNLDADRHGLLGWNQGFKSEDMGRITGVHFKLKPSFFRVDRTNGNGILTQGYDNQTFQFWAVDMFDRVFYQEFNCRVNGSYETIDIQFGPNAQQLLYFNRLDELQLFGGFTSPWNFFLREKEFTGVAFDWRFVKCCGWQWKGANDETNQYKLMIENNFQNIWNGVLQILNGSATISAGLSGVNVNNELDYGTIALDEFYFIKELYVNSSDSILLDPRVTVEYDDAEPDYYNAKTKAQAMAIRNQYYPLFVTYQSTGDVRMRLGQTFQVQGGRVPNGSDTYVCSEVTHRINKDGYKMTVTGIKKFVLPIVNVTPSYGTSSTSFTITGSSFTPNGPFNIYIDNTQFINIQTFDNTGAFTKTGLFSTTTGLHSVTIQDTTSGVSATATYQVF